MTEQQANRIIELLEALNTKLDAMTTDVYVYNPEKGKFEATGGTQINVWVQNTVKTEQD